MLLLQRKSAVLPACTIDIIDSLPGDLMDRHTPLGELNWILTTITDTIAWSVLPRQLFLRLFRHDLSVALMFRNFLLADVIMREAGVTPRSYPPLPPTHNHPLWESWNVVVELLLHQLIRNDTKRREEAEAAAAIAAATVAVPAPSGPAAAPAVTALATALTSGGLTPISEKTKRADAADADTPSRQSSTKKESRKTRDGGEDKPKKSKKSTKDGDPKASKSKKKHKSKEKRAEPPPVESGRSSAVTSIQPTVRPQFQPSTFFDDQLQAFEVWLQCSRYQLECTPPQLPVVLQVSLL